MLTMHVPPRDKKIRIEDEGHSGISGPGEDTGRDKERGKTEGGVGDGE